VFTGIIEQIGTITQLVASQSNLHITISAAFTNELKIDQSVAHNGICLTVVAINGNEYTVTAIEETLKKTNLGEAKVGEKVNLERCMPANGRFDGHIVQGHVDETATCQTVTDENGSWLYTFKLLNPDNTRFIVNKGSITINGISLTVVSCNNDLFKVAIIPYTYEHTNLHEVKSGNTVNIEFDIIGKYVAKMMAV
jgi:riboflavin synthase